MSIGWIYLSGAIILGLVANYLVKYSDGFTHLYVGIAGIALLVVVNILWTFAIKYMPLSVAYVTWSAIATVGVIAISVIWFGEVMTLAKVALITIILVATIALNLLSKAQ